MAHFHILVTARKNGAFVGSALHCIGGIPSHFATREAAEKEAEYLRQSAPKHGQRFTFGRGPSQLHYECDVEVLPKEAA